MKALVCQTQPMVPIGSLGEPLRAAGIELVTWWAGRDPAPESLEGFGAVVALGGAANPDEDDRYPWLGEQRRMLREALNRELPTLGPCLGAQLLAEVAGARTRRLDRPAIGWLGLTATRDGRRDPLYRSLPAHLHVFEWHSYGFNLPADAALLAGAPDAAQAFRIGPRAWGLQFHLEATERIVAEWIGHYADELRVSGPDPHLLATETTQRIGDQERHASAFGAAFAELMA